MDIIYRYYFITSNNMGKFRPFFRDTFEVLVFETAVKSLLPSAYDVAEECSVVDLQVDPIVFPSPGRSDDGEAKSSVAEICYDAEVAGALFGKKHRFL